jgi:aryl-alcohol dehydrogenase-like predicted oxidoreductase
VREIGCSNFSAAQLREADAVSRRGHLARFVSVQNHYNMFVRADENDAIPECERLGIAYLPYFPLESGLLTGKYRRGHGAPAGTRIAEGGWLASKFTDENLAKVEQLIVFAERRKHTLLELTMSWLLRHAVVASVIAGATRPDQVNANATSASWKLTSEDIEAVDEILNGA